MPTDAQRRNLASAHRAEVQELTERIALLEQQLDSTWETLARIGDFAHDKSTGPAVPDALWEIRSMAYEAVRPAIDAAITSTQEQT